MTNLYKTKYSTNLNDPSLSMDNVATFREFKNTLYANATGTATIPSSGGNSGKVMSIAVANGSNGYKYAPIVHITGDGTGATAHAVIGNYGVVTSFVVDATGSGYTSAVITTTPDPREPSRLGMTELYKSTDLLNDVLTNLSQLSTEITTLTTAIQLAQAATDTRKTAYVSQLHAIKFYQIMSKALHLNYRMKQLSANINLVAPNEYVLPADSKDPSSLYRGY